MTNGSTIKQTDSRPGRAVRGAAAVTAQYIRDLSSRQSMETLNARPAPTLRPALRQREVTPCPS